MQRVRDLSLAATDVKPRNRDWSEGYAETWEYWDAQECGASLDGGGYCSETILNTDSECPKGHEIHDVPEGPMMNYFYPLPDLERDADAAARMLEHLPLCVVHLIDSDEWGLALTGGGMNLSWEICAAYIALGYCPPLHFCADLPRMAGKSLTAGNRLVLAAAEKTARAELHAAHRSIQRIREMRKYLREAKS